MRNVPDNWDLNAWFKCKECGVKYHVSEGCNCVKCECCEQWLSPNRMHDGEVCYSCRKKIDNGEIFSPSTKRKIAEHMKLFDQVIKETKDWAESIDYEDK